jgi:hypothetical protein
MSNFFGDTVLDPLNVLPHFELISNNRYNYLETYSLSKYFLIIKIELEADVISRVQVVFLLKCQHIRILYVQ